MTEAIEEPQALSIADRALAASAGFSVGFYSSLGYVLVESLSASGDSPHSPHVSSAAKPSPGASPAHPQAEARTAQSPHNHHGVQHVAEIMVGSSVTGILVASALAAAIIPKLRRRKADRANLASIPRYETLDPERRERIDSTAARAAPMLIRNFEFYLRRQRRPEE
jgi:hypothetical protein